MYLMSNETLKNKVIDLRKKGKTYRQICDILKHHIPKSTLSYWLKGVKLSIIQKKEIRRQNLKHLSKIRKIALVKKQALREKYFQTILTQNKNLGFIAKDCQVAKIMLVMLYWCEGSKSGKGALTFGNSDPKIIELFLRLMRQVYNIDENKLRCTVQCRYGQNALELERFWRKITSIPKDKFYPAVIDERTKGKPLKKKNYKGVCRIDCFSANIYHELTTIPKVFE